MSATIAMARRELMSYLLAPAGYIIIAVFMLATALMYFLWGMLWGGGFNQGDPASLQLVFSGGIFVFLFVAPAISMRTMSEEYRLGTIESLLTSPVNESQIILGKFIGAFAFLLAMLLPTLLYVVALERYGRPDYGQLACGYGGMILAGGAFLATGLLFSTVTRSQVLAYLATLFFWLILLIATKGLPTVVALSENWGVAGQDNDALEWLRKLSMPIARTISAADPQQVVRDFAVGLVDSYNVAYLLMFIIVPLVAAIVLLRLRRMR